MSSKVGIIIRREYMERVKKKSFIFTTILMPLVMLGLMFTPVLIAMFSEGENRTVLVVDNSGMIVPNLINTPGTTYEKTDLSVDQARAREDVDAVLVIPSDIVDNNAGMLTMYTNGASSLNLESDITQQINKIVETNRLEKYDIQDLDKIISAVQSNVSLQSFRNDEDSRQSSTMLSYLLGITLTMILYMCLLLYGQMVMTSIIEEKSNRVLELVVSSVKPMQLMLGKICGIGLVAVTQIVLWTILIAVMSGVLLPAMLPADLAQQASAVHAGTADAATLSADVDLLAVIATLGDVSYIITLFGLLLLFLVGGFMLYAAIYAAIGSAVDNIQDAGQLQSIVVFPIIFGIIFAMTAASDPTSGMAFWTSIIPFTSPMVMMARIPFGIPAWEIAVSLVVLFASFIFMVWLAGKIYRVGIFMYGKKPTIKELIRWVNYK